MGEDREFEARRGEFARSTGTAAAAALLAVLVACGGGNGSDTETDAAVTTGPAAAGPSNAPAAASRFLTQATFGPTSAEITRLSLMIYSGWIDEQFAKPQSYHINSLSGTLFGSTSAAASLKSIVTASNQHLFANEYGAIVKRSVDAQASFQAAFTLSTVTAPTQYVQPSVEALANNGLASQLQTVARIIGARAGLGAKRQVFFVSMGGFDTHDGQNRNQADLLARLSHALAYLDTALAGLAGGDMRNAVALFSASDFGRTLTSNGDGTDHGWGGGS